MALNVASLLDGASLGQGTLDKALTGMNKVLTIKNVALETRGKCNVIVTIGVRSYLFSTQSNGVLQVSAVAGAELIKALAKCDARLVLDPVAFNNEVGNLGEAWEEALRERRKMCIEGDETMYVALHNALVPHVTSLQAATPTVTTTQESSLAMDIWKGLEPPSLQVASLSPDSWQPPLGDQLRGWLMFSAVSTMNGNMGQSNYVASNQVMDALTFNRRMHGSHFEATTMMWGTVGHMGMRWKAFGSADMIYQTEGSEDDVVMMPFEAAIVLKTIFQGVCPEWFVANKFDRGTEALFKAGGMPVRSMWRAETHGAAGIPNPGDPWGFGKGGGTQVQGHDLPDPLQSQSATEPKRATASGSTAYTGRRVRLHRLQKMPEMNGKKGTLIEEVEDGQWIVRLDGGLGDKMLKASNLMTLSGLQLGVGGRCADAVDLPPADVYVKAA